MELVKNLFPFYRLLFFVVQKLFSFAVQKLFSFMRSQLLIVDLSACTISVLFRKSSPLAMSSRLSLTFSSVRFSVFGFMLRFLIYMDLSIVQGDKYGSICILLYAAISLTSTIC